LVPKSLEKSGLMDGGDNTPESLGLTDEAIKYLVRRYCREAGVRNLEQHIEKIFRKVALEVVEELEKNQDPSTPTSETEENSTKSFLITEETLEKYVGKPIFTS